MTIIQIGMDEALKIHESADESKYKDFVDKFKPKKTTDDCYTPATVYDAVAGWVSEEYNVDPGRFVRPFYPGRDYQADTYPDGCVVVDNPPFSIITEICCFYLSEGIKFFLFAPALTLFGGRQLDVTYLPAGCPIVYANGAEVPTSFITNLDTCRVRTCPELYRRVEIACDVLRREGKVTLPKYIYPDHVITAAMVQRWTKYGVEYRLSKESCARISALDSQRAVGKRIFGCGFILSERAAAERAAAERAAAERAAAERAAAERAAAERWELSAAEKMIIQNLE